MNDLALIIIGIIIAGLIILGLSTGASDSKIKKNLLSQKDRAMHPAPDKSLLRTQPAEGDLILGKHGTQYVCWDMNKDAHILIIGGSGSGKSSCLVLPFLLTNPNSTVFAIDIKGELVVKGRMKNDPRICVFSPHDHSGFGFDVFYGINRDSSPQEILQTMQTIAFSLIPLGDKDKFWNISARNMFIGLLIYYFNTGRNSLISCIDAILGSPVRDQLEEIANNAEPGSNEYKYLNQFIGDGMADETLLSVYMNMSNPLSCFSDTNLRWAFAEAPRKVNPLVLEQRKSIFLSIPEHKLSAWSGPLAMIVNLTLDELSKRPENSHRIVFLLDELGRIISSGGALDGLVDASMTLRSRKVSLCLVVQQIESLSAGFAESKVTTLVGNCNIKVVLDASSSKTQKTVCTDWVPKYIQRKQSKSSGKNRSSSYNYEEKDCLVPSDLMSLTKNGEAVIITPLGYMMLHKCPYFKDKYLQPVSEQIHAYNAQFL